MSYFGRLAQRVGPAAPRGPVAPAFAATPNASDAVGPESFAEVTVPGTRAAVDIARAPAAPAPQSRPQPQADFAERERHAFVDTHSRDWIALDSPVAPEGSLDRSPASSSDLRAAAAPVEATGEPDIASPAPGRIERNPPGRPWAAVASVADTTPARSHPPQVAPEADEDIAAPARRIVPAAPRDRNQRDTRQQRAIPSATRTPAPQEMRANSVEVRIGAVTLQVHAPPAPPPAAVRASFAPHRHYLRMW